MKYDVICNVYEILRLYDSGHSLRHISNVFCISRKSIRSFIVNKRIIRDAVSQLFINAKINNQMSTWFDDINSHLKAYWLGFIFADGSVSKNERQMEIDLSVKDADHLEKFAKLFNVGISYDYYRCRCRVCNVYFCSRLIYIGILPNKSYLDNTSIFDNVPFKFINSFILGFMDGDGSVYKDKRRKKYIIVNFSGRKSVLSCIKNRLVDNLGVNINKILPDKNIFSVSWSGKQAQKVLEWLYKDSPIRLERKYKIYRECLNK